MSAFFVGFQNVLFYQCDRDFCKLGNAINVPHNEQWYSNNLECRRYAPLLVRRC